MKIKTAVLTCIFAIILFLAGCSFIAGNPQIPTQMLEEQTPYVSMTHSTHSSMSWLTLKTTPLS